jgi:predicted DsbA family dithiol-disulfide isomerase
VVNHADAPLPLQVDIVSDVVCPWCVIGYKQLEAALESAGGRFAARIRWHAFELNPQLPAKGQNLREHLAQKAGITPAQSAAAREQLGRLGDELGFRFNFSDDMRISNTFRAHQLLAWAADSGRQTALKLALFNAYFGERRDMNDPDVLLAAVVDAGLPVEEARSVLAEERFADAVRAEEQQWRNQDLRSVPTFIFNGRYAVMGAQGVDAFARILDRVGAA